ncbi:beta-galactosidase [Spartobacteria bacterium LR76]|nr:beta-galactosidase [Spartobacteria bacterium LR76]
MSLMCSFLFESRRKWAVILGVLFFLRPAVATDIHKFEIGRDAFLLDGKPFIIRCGEVHAARIPREYWRHRLQMARAMGLNTVCAYLFWNQHEPREGVFDWSDRADIADFCRIAQEEGLWVILRPGPYACAEWEMGGLPWWLLKHEGMKLRSRDGRFLVAARRYLKDVGRNLAPLQVTRGGPILLVQAENEYGFFGKDAEYMGEIRQALLDAGFEVPIFSCNPVNSLRNGYRPDVFPVVNFGSDPGGGFSKLRQILPTGPLMCGEFYPGWFDTWGQPHHRGDAMRYLRDLETMLKMKASFSIYMAHGGTSFGFTAGADRPFKPDTTSYDYDAPISEAGWATDKFFKTRALISRYLQPGETLTEPPPAPPVVTFALESPAGFAPLLACLPKAVEAKHPLSFEQLDQPYGLVLYSTIVPAGPAVQLRAAAVHDIGIVSLGGVRVGAFDRRSRTFALGLPSRANPTVLEILVEAMGRVNFGQEIHDSKGLHGPVFLGDSELTGWEMFLLPLDAEQLEHLAYASLPENHGPGFFHFDIELKETGDTFLDLRPFGKGMVWVNGHNLGRFWNIGPQQTLFVPGPWLHPGRNKFVVLDLLGDDGAPKLAGLEKPVVDQLRPELDTLSGHRTLARVRVPGASVVEGSFPQGGNVQEIHFPQNIRGRYFTLMADDAQDGGPHAAIADISLLGGAGDPLDTQNLTIAGASSEETVAEAGGAGNAIDGQISNYWHSRWKSPTSGYPHWITLDLGREETLSGFIYTPRQGADRDAIGRLKHFRALVGNSTEDIP